MSRFWQRCSSLRQHVAAVYLPTSLARSKSVILLCNLTREYITYYTTQILEQADVFGFGLAQLRQDTARLRRPTVQLQRQIREDL